MVYKIYTSPVAEGCNLMEQPQMQVISNVLDVTSPASFALAPGESAYLTLRVFDAAKATGVSVVDWLESSTTPVPIVQAQAPNTHTCDADGNNCIPLPPETTLPPAAVPPATPLFIAPLQLSAGNAGQPYFQALVQASAGAVLPYSWSVSAGALPPGLTINPGTGLISGTTTASGTYTFTARVEDSSVPTHQSASRQYAIVIGGGISFPQGYIPFTSLYYVSAPSANGDRLVVGNMTMAAFSQMKNLILLPSSPNQMFEDSAIELAPGVFSSRVYIPTAAERVGDFSSFGGALMDPTTNLPFPNNIIPANRLPDPFAFRVNGPTTTGGVSAIAGLGGGSLALESDGTVWAWGRNSDGQLGDGTTTDRTTPVQVSGLTGVVAIAGGWYHGLALKSDGTVWAWGRNSDGQLGDGTTTNRLTPVQVSGLTGVVAIAGGYWHSLALKTDGTVWAWGHNDYGQLGDGSTTNRTVSVQVTGLQGVTAIAGGAEHGLALSSDGTVWAWGHNDDGQLGNETTTDSSVPVQVTGLTGVAVIAAGVHSLAVKSDGTAWGWGHGVYGELGDGGVGVNRSTPVQAIGLTGVVGIAGGSGHSLWLKSDGTVWASGLNWYGQLGDGTTTERHTPVQVSGLTGVLGMVAIAAGLDHSLALRSDGTVWAWGQNYGGQLGDGSTTNRSAPVQVRANGPTGVTAIAGGSAHSLALKSDGTAWAWGFNGNGQLGDGTTTRRSRPVQVSGLTGVITVAAGYQHSLALRSDGTVWAWGFNGNGQLGDNSTTDSSVPVQVIGLTGVTAIAAGGYHSLALKSDGTVWAWGRNDYGQLGDGTTSNHPTPVQVSGLTGAVAIAGGGFHSLALKSDGSVWAWGYGYWGQLGNGNTANLSVPVQVSGLAGVAAVAGGGGHSLALKSDGSVWAWGYNGQGELGDGTTTSRSVPGQVGAGFTGLAAIAAGEFHTLALKSDGTAWAWGANDRGQLGDGTTLESHTPVQVGWLTRVWAIAVGGHHSLALKSDGMVLAWGWNGDGQLGDGTRIDSSVPVETIGLTGLTLVYTDPVGDNTGNIDVTQMLLVFDNTTGDYTITLWATATNPFIGAFRVNINLFNPDTDPDACFFQDTIRDFSLATATRRLILTGTNTSLLRWQGGQRVATSSLAGVGNPPGSTWFRSAVMNYPFQFMTNEDTIAYDLTGLQNISH
jgi:alpha-tubulin suppressor-like RCC1 family protein